MSEALLSAFTSASSPSQIYFVTGEDTVTIDGTLIFAIATPNGNDYNQYAGAGIVTATSTYDYFACVSYGGSTFKSSISYSPRNKTVSASSGSGATYISFTIVAAYTKD